MTSSAKSVTTTSKVVNNRTGVTRSVSRTVTGNQTTVTRTTTIGTPKKVSSSKSSTTTPAKAAGAVLADRWITGPNDDGWTLCGAVAVANHLLAVTGLGASNAAIERLYRDAGGLGDSGAPVPSLLAAAATVGLAGCRLASWSPAVTAADAGLVLMLLPGIPDAHAAAIIPGGLAVMWGDEVPLASLDALVLDAWTLSWHGQET
jgi:hypothetical protein